MKVRIWLFFCSRLSGRYAMVALRKVNFNQIPKIIPKIPVSDCKTFLALSNIKHDILKEMQMKSLQFMFLSFV